MRFSSTRLGAKKRGGGGEGSNLPALFIHVNGGGGGL